MFIINKNQSQFFFAIKNCGAFLKFIKNKLKKSKNVDRLHNAKKKNNFNHNLYEENLGSTTNRRLHFSE